MVSSPNHSQPGAFSVASYNVLATAYIHPGRYPRTPQFLLHPTWRLPALVQYIVNLDADVLCLQEVERATFAACQARLRPLGYAGHYAPKRGNRPDGCATFYRQERFALQEVIVLPYDDSPNTASGHIALLVVLQSAGGLLGIANTHLVWDPPQTPPDAQRGVRQIEQCLTAPTAMPEQGWILCGDFNVTPESAVVTVLQQAGFRYAHAGLKHTYTCNPHAQAKMIDYLFYTPSLCAAPRPVARIDHHTPLPSADHPSDHLPVVSQFFWNPCVTLPAPPDASGHAHPLESARSSSRPRVDGAAPASKGH